MTRSSFCVCGIRSCESALGARGGGGDKSLLWRDAMAMCKINILGILFIVYWLDFLVFGFGLDVCGDWLQVKECWITIVFLTESLASQCPPPFSYQQRRADDDIC